MDIEIYTKENCPGCKATKRWLESHQISFDEINIDTRPDIIAELKSQGLLQVPVVKAGQDSWSGFRPEKLRSIPQKLQGLLSESGSKQQSSHQMPIHTPVPATGGEHKAVR